MNARGIQFWTLLLLSAIVSLLMIKQIFLCRAIIRAQHDLVSAHEIADSDNVYQTAWEKLAMAVYRAGAEDPAMRDLLKTEGISVHEGPPPGSATNAAPTPAAVPVPAASSKPLQAPQHP